MKKMGKNSSFVLVLLAGLVMLLHAIVPHHHHFDSYGDHNYSNTSTTETHSESSADAEKHCHVLNNIVFTKANTITVEANAAIYALLFFITAVSLVKLYESIRITTFPIRDFVIQKQFLSTDLSHRGPPTLV